ncbi:4-hydroxy-tetrahydrodipicolinate synthase [Reichenbachiella carrageenanivorans]|uniref:4-hydroxy-tetrahydrodipicolinate synthase n=1 Tax=Reichenbachiella carrageenanivorans TaxID=2979869 RepID=A0ABY6CY46_9BACT|nr:4-hydroxy-tetrahydrodipicolinate synthase [Reichenbachiella carrageenanivorans]UXX78835.1 4-hydroxy-tetrahydrodipicolinate synthase [Reichenbachiella carrageenanivorans]
MDKFKGTGVALVTPFKEDLSVDYTALEQLVNHVSGGGVDYLVVMGTTAESPTLTGAEKLEVLRFVKSKNHKNLPVVYGLGGNDTMALVSKFKKFQEDVDAFLVVCPFYNKPSQRGLQLHFEAIAAAAKKPVILYNVPKRTSVNMTAKTVVALAQHPNIIGIKEASGDTVVQAEEIARKMPDDFLLISGDDDLITPFIKCGGHGVISVIANALPGHTSDLVNAALAADYSKAKVMANDMEEILGLLFSEGNPTGVKELLRQMGIGNGGLRLPLVEASEGLKEKIANEYKVLDTKKGMI